MQTFAGDPIRHILVYKQDAVWAPPPPRVRRQSQAEGLKLLLLDDVLKSVFTAHGYAAVAEKGERFEARIACLLSYDNDFMVEVRASL